MMKKLCCLMLAVALCLGLSGCSFTLGRMAAYDQAGRYSIGSFAYDAGAVDTVEINWRSGEIHLTEKAGPRLSVTEAAGKLSEAQQMHWLLDGGTLRIQFCESGYRGPITGNKKLEMEIPAGIDLRVNCTSGDVFMGEHTLGALAVNITSGDVRLGNARAASAAFNSTSGDVTTGLLDVAGALAVNSTSGDTRIEALQAQSARLNSTSGNIDLGLYQCGDTNISCTSGSVRLTVHPDHGAAVDYSTSSGSLNGRSVKNKAAHIEVGGGECRARVSTTSGSLTVTEKEGDRR